MHSAAECVRLRETPVGEGGLNGLRTVIPPPTLITHMHTSLTA